MRDRDDLIGYLLLALCAAVGAVLVFSIVTGTRLRFDGPAWVGWLLALIFFGGIIYGLVAANGRRWPDPLTGLARRRWPWSRKRDDDPNR